MFLQPAVTSSIRSFAAQAQWNRNEGFLSKSKISVRWIASRLLKDKKNVAFVTQLALGATVIINQVTKTMKINWK